MSKILLIEDDRDLRESLVTILELEGYHTIYAADSRMGLHLAQQTCPDVMVCDVDLPDLDGLSLLKLLRRDPRTVQVPVIMLTANIYEDARLEAMTLGIDAYLFKPCPAKRLLSAIERSLHPPFSATIAA